MFSFQNLGKINLFRFFYVGENFSRMSKETKLILSDKFYSPKLKDQINVDLNETTLILYNSNVREELLLDDLIGSFAEDSFNLDHLCGSRLILNSFPRTNPKELKRHKISIELIYNSNKNDQKNSSIVKNWQNQLELLTKHQIYNEISAVGNALIKTKPLLIFVNPNSGAGKANKLFIYQISRVFNQANCKTKVIITGLLIKKIFFLSKSKQVLFIFLRNITWKLIDLDNQ